MKNKFFLIGLAVVIFSATLICLLPITDSFSYTLDAVAMADGMLSDQTVPVKLSGKEYKYLLLDDKMQISIGLPNQESIIFQEELFYATEDICYMSGLYYDPVDNVYQVASIFCNSGKTQFVIQLKSEIYVASADPQTDMQAVFDRLFLSRET